MFAPSLAYRDGAFTLLLLIAANSHNFFAFPRIPVWKSGAVFGFYPSSFQLPTEKEYETLFGTTYNWTNGWSWADSSASAIHDDDSLTFPASGYRNGIDGDLGNVGTNGIYWSASPFSASNGYVLLFASSFVGSSNNFRADGLPVRCVQ